MHVYNDSRSKLKETTPLPESSRTIAYDDLQELRELGSFQKQKQINRQEPTNICGEFQSDSTGSYPTRPQFGHSYAQLENSDELVLGDISPGSFSCLWRGCAAFGVTLSLLAVSGL